MSRARAVVESLQHLGRNEAANTLAIFALAMPVLVGAVGAAVDYSGAAGLRTKMQAVADAAALAAVQEMQLAQSDQSRIAAVANNYVAGALQGVSPTVNVDFQALTVQVIMEKQYSPIMGSLIVQNGLNVRVSATAKMNGSMPLCMLGLDPSAPATISLEHSAVLMASGCLVQSNSKSTVGLKSKDDAVLHAGLICSVGGKVQSKNANYAPAPVTDCPALPDPLASRSPPPVGACNFTNKVVDGATETLQPGVYCGGLTLTNNAVGNLAKGIFVIKDGPLVVTRGASISGTEVGFYLKGTGANLTFDAESTINLSAPKDGPMAGILIFDDPSGSATDVPVPRGVGPYGAKTFLTN